MGRALCLLLLSLPLAGCGFALRSNDVLSAQFERLELELSQPNNEFSRLLRRSLTVANVDTALTSANSDQVPLLRIGPEQIVSRPITVNPRARAAQYELRLSVAVAMARGETVLIAPETLFVERIYFEDIENISGNQEEVTIITAEMRRELVNQLLRRLEAAGT